MTWFKKTKTEKEMEEEKLKAEMWKARFDAIFAGIKSVSAAGSMFVALIIFLGNSGWISYKFVKSHNNNPAAAGESVVKADKEVMNHVSGHPNKKVTSLSGKGVIKKKIIKKKFKLEKTTGVTSKGGGAKASPPSFYEEEQTALSKGFNIPSYIFHILLYLLVIGILFHTIWKMIRNKKHGKKWTE